MPRTCPHSRGQNSSGLWAPPAGVHCESSPLESSSPPAPRMEGRGWTAGASPGLPRGAGAAGPGVGGRALQGPKSRLPKIHLQSYVQTFGFLLKIYKLYSFIKITEGLHIALQVIFWQSTFWPGWPPASCPGPAAPAPLGPLCFPGPSALGRPPAWTHPTISTPGDMPGLISRQAGADSYPGRRPIG